MFASEWSTNSDSLLISRASQAGRQARSRSRILAQLAARGSGAISDSKTLGCRAFENDNRCLWLPGHWARLIVGKFNVG